MRKLNIFLSLLLCINLFILAPSSSFAEGESIELDTELDPSVTDDVYQTEQTIQEQVRNYISEFYFTEVPEEILLQEDLKELVSSLQTQFNDPWTEYYTAREYQDFLNALNQQYGGIGVALGTSSEGVEIREVYNDSPAQSVGLKPGDLILAVYGTSVQGRSESDIASLLRGEVDTEVRLTVKSGEEQRELTLIRKYIHLPLVTGELIEDDIGYIRIYSMGEDTYTQFLEAMEDLIQKGAKGYILDLRGNGGGYVVPSLEIADAFLPDDQNIITIKEQVEEYDIATADGTIIDPRTPIVMLVDRNTASSSELLTIALRDNKRATIVGETTYGKALMQEPFTLEDGSFLKVSVSEMIGPRGESHNRVGIKPDLSFTSLPGKDWLPISVLMMKKQGSPQQGDLEVDLPSGQRLALAFVDLHSPKFWSAAQAIIRLSDPNAIKVFDGNEWRLLSASEVDKEWPVYFYGYKDMGQLNGVSPDKTFTVVFSHEMDQSTAIRSDEIALLEKATGNQISVSFNWKNTKELEVLPQESLKENVDYWLVIKPTMKSINGPKLKRGVVLEVNTKLN